LGTMGAGGRHEIICKQGEPRDWC